MALDLETPKEEEKKEDEETFTASPVVIEPDATILNIPLRNTDVEVLVSPASFSLALIPARTSASPELIMATLLSVILRTAPFSKMFAWSTVKLTGSSNLVTKTASSAMNSIRKGSLYINRCNE